jgi:Barstar (barnase inhibitor)
MNPESLQKLLLPTRPWLFRTLYPYSDITNTLWSFQRQSAGSVVRFVRGKKMTTVQGFYDEFAAAMQFPYYFGYNAAAFDECLTDLSWLPAMTYVLVILDSADLLRTVPTQLPVFLDGFERICAQWSAPIAKGESWDRSAVPFHVIFQYVGEDESRLPREIAKLPGV